MIYVSFCRCILCVTEKDVEPVLPVESRTEEDKPEVETSEHNKKLEKPSEQKQNIIDGAKKSLHKDTAAAENDSKTKKVEEKTKNEDNIETGLKSKKNSKQKSSKKKGYPLSLSFFLSLFLSLSLSLSLSLCVCLLISETYFTYIFYRSDRKEKRILYGMYRIR